MYPLIWIYENLTRLIARGETTHVFNRDKFIAMEDVVETLLGMEIVDEMDQVEDMQALARRQWEKRAKAHSLKRIIN